MLAGKTIAITRSRDDSEEFVNLVRAQNAIPMPLPTIQLVSKGDKIVDQFLQSAGSYDPDYSVFMSSKAVRLLFDTAKQASKFDELRLAVAGTNVMAVGPKTRAALEEYGVRVAHVPSTYSSVGVGELFTRLGAVGKKVLVPRSGASTPFLKQLLNKIGLDVQEIHLYDVCAFKDTSQWNEFRDLFVQDKIDAIVFTSASSVRSFFEIMEKDHTRQQLAQHMGQIKSVSIGPFTADELKKFGIPHITSKVHTVEGSFDMIKSMF